MLLLRLVPLIIKELQAVLGNWRGRLLLIVPVILQTAIFPFAATLEVKHSSLAIYNEDGGAVSIELMQRLSHTAAFEQIILVHSQTQLQAALDGQRALLALHFPADFSRRVLAGQSAPLQVLLDGRRSNSGQIASGYIQQVVNSYLMERGLAAPARASVRHVTNPNLDYKWHILPSLVAIITTIGCLIVTGLSVAREREEGTFDQLLVSPLTPAYIMLGKAVPGMLIALLQGSVIATAAHWAYGVPFTGSFSLLMVGMLFYGLALAGVGLFISSLCNTQQQAFLGMFAFTVPAVILSGYVSPIENMPVFLQGIAAINPLTYFIKILKGVFLKDLGWTQVWPYLWPLLMIALVSLSLALRMFRRQSA